MGTSEPLAYFAEVIERELGIVYTPDNFFQLNNRLEELVRQMRFANIEELQRTFASSKSPELRQLLLDSATNNETSFFRDQKPFEALRETILPTLAKKLDAPLKIWSAASSTGQEAYSIAMTIEEMKREFPKLRAEILASDVSERVLKRTRDAIYSPLEMQRGLPPDLFKYFRKVGEDHHLKPEIRGYVRTATVNLCSEFQHVGQFHVVFCRNVLIYQNLERKARIIAGLRRCLLPGGYLIMGAGESMLGLSQDYDQRNLGAIVYQLKVA